MTDDNHKKYDGKMVHRGAEHASPYPVSRLAPSIDLVDLAKEISQADTMINNVATAKLRVIADQMKALQAEARSVLEAAKHNQTLHRAQCNFKRKAGKLYHLYQKNDESSYFSMLSLEDWGGKPPHTYLGSYRLEADMSWTPVEQLDKPDETGALIQRLLGESR